MKLELKAKHFEGTDYVDLVYDCAIEKAYTELTGNRCSGSINNLFDLDLLGYFNHKRYGFKDFNSDKLKAQSHNWDETVIRTIELTEV